MRRECVHVSEWCVRGELLVNTWGTLGIQGARLCLCMRLCTHSEQGAGLLQRAATKGHQSLLIQSSEVPSVLGNARTAAGPTTC